MIDNKQIWESCLNEIENNLSRANFVTWFKNTRLAKQENGTAYIGVPNEFVKDWLKNKHEKLILKVLMNYSNNIRNVEFNIYKHNPNKKEGELGNSQNIIINNELPLNNLYIDKRDNLNPRYVFDTFVVGSFNELAFAAAQAIIKNPGKSYNPFFVYGPTGLGKTHLIQAIGNSIKEKFPGKTVHYIPLEKFAVDYVNSLRNNKPNEFKQKYRQYDVLIMDDVQFISNKEKTQEELFHLFNSLYENNKQIVFSSDKHPNYIPGLEDRLRSRFGSGMIVDVTEPEAESKIAIIKSKLEENGIDLADDIIEYIALSISGSIRELEGTLNTIICQIQFKKRDLTLLEVKKLIKNNIKPKKSVSVQNIVKTISDFYDISEDSVYEKTRRKEIVKARQIIMYILREDFSVSYPLIGQKLGGKDHTTVIHSCLKIKNDLKEDPKLVEEIEQIRIMFN
ncbi:MAG: chromosomal replication initiator protein DnaA [Candidatus Paceibacterota bacterium]